MHQAPQRHAKAPQTDRPALPLEALWQTSTLVFIVLAGELLAVILALAPGIDGSRWVYFGLTSILIQWISLLTVSALALLRRPLARLRPLNVAYLALAILLVVTSVVCSMLWLVLHEKWILQHEAWRALWLQFTGIALAVGLIGVAIFRSHWNARQMAVRAKQAQLDALQARIQPHFLFNTLNTCAALIHGRPEDAEQLLLDLADLFRATLSGPQEIPLEEELALTRRYIEIESLRFGHRMRVHWQLPEPLPQRLVPNLSIQPLVENAIHHGIEPSPEGGEVRIAVTQSKNLLQITISNDLPPAGSHATRSGHKIGLESTRARVQAMTGGAGDVTTLQQNGRHITTITLPA